MRHSKLLCVIFKVVVVGAGRDSAMTTEGSQLDYLTVTFHFPTFWP